MSIGTPFRANNNPLAKQPPPASARNAAGPAFAGPGVLGKPSVIAEFSRAAWASAF